MTDAFTHRSELGEVSRDLIGRTWFGWAATTHPTARDVVCYLYAAFLERRAMADEWLGRRFALDPARLLGPFPRGVPASADPVTRLAAALDDLERWHAAAGRRDAALDARLERARSLYVTLPSQTQRDAVVADLRRRLATCRELSRWSMGMAELALLVRESGTDLAEPLAIAEEGRRGRLDTEGGKRCDAIARTLRFELDDPEVLLWAATTAVVGSPPLVARHTGGAELHLRASPRPLADVVEDRWPAIFAATTAYPRGTPAPTPANPIPWTVALPTPPGRVRTTTSILAPPLERGLYLVEATLAKEFGPRPRATLVLVTDLVLTVSQRERALYVRSRRPPPDVRSRGRACN